MRYAVVIGGNVRNFIEWDGETELVLPQGAVVRLALHDDEISLAGQWANVDEARSDLAARIEARARMMRVSVAGTSDATKLAVYRQKYETAVAALAGDPDALDALEMEATARGETPAELAALVKFLGDAWTAAGLAIDAAYQTHKGAITALPNLAAAEAYDLNAHWPGA